MPRFVVLTHDYPDCHWDFMLESAGVLRTWRLEQTPHLPSSIKATPLPDHRIIYLEYEGPVGGQRGHVQRWDQGHYELLCETDGNLTIALHGTRLQGQATLSSEQGATSFHFTADSGMSRDETRMTNE